MAFLYSIDYQQLECLVVAHISQQNNSLELTQQAFDKAQSAIDKVIYACQDEGFGWVSLSN